MLTESPAVLTFLMLPPLSELLEPLPRSTPETRSTEVVLDYWKEFNLDGRRLQLDKQVLPWVGVVNVHCILAVALRPGHVFKWGCLL